MKETPAPSGDLNDASGAAARVSVPPLTVPYAESGDGVLTALRSSHHGLSRLEAATRLEQYGRNALPRAKPSGIVRVFLHQFI
ncbi:MAG: hypothetical protein JRJ40_09060, partial [Deltaproteobacteria bacterium]|nr:hypothetical protein [Deltaproteobacteria bacterium]